MDKDETLRILNELLEEARQLRYNRWGDLDRVVSRTEMLLRRIFGAATHYLEILKSINYWSMSSLASEREDAFQQGTDKLRNLIGTLIEELTLFGDEPPYGLPAFNPGSRRVFIVHGQDEALREAVARLLLDFDLVPVILHEQPNRGRTIIEKFEDFTDVSFAIVLLTPDDLGYRRNASPDEARPRARQNVLLELGFFLGRLTRQRVAALHPAEEAFEMPSDYSGVIFIPVDQAGAWRLKIVAELQAAGVSVDANKLLPSTTSR